MSTPASTRHRNRRGGGDRDRSIDADRNSVDRHTATSTGAAMATGQRRTLPPRRRRQQACPPAPAMSIGSGKCMGDCSGDGEVGIST
jgi:hypothetical protein